MTAVTGLLRVVRVGDSIRESTKPERDTVLANVIRDALDAA